MSICPLRHTLSFHLYGYGRLLLHVRKPYLHVNFGIETFGIRCHKIDSEEFDISGKMLVCPYGD